MKSGMKAADVQQLNREEHASKFSKVFILSAGTLLIIAGAAKILSAFGRSAVLAKPDPILGIEFQQFLLLVGFIELVVAVLCLSSASQYTALGLVAGLSLNFAGYRTALWLIGWHGYCPCLGSLTQAIHLSRQRADVLSQTILGYLLVGSFSLLAWRWWQRKERGSWTNNRRTSPIFSRSSDFIR